MTATGQLRDRLRSVSRGRRQLAEQTSAVDPSRLGDRIGHLSFDELRAVDAALRLVMSL
jgi:mRNA interferase MazF